eukprot:8830684-Ditylum_brightwellii.AAC.1
MSQDWAAQLRPLFPGCTANEIIQIIAGLKLEEMNTNSTLAATIGISLLSHCFHSPTDDPYLQAMAKSTHFYKMSLHPTWCSATWMLFSALSLPIAQPL